MIDRRTRLALFPVALLLWLAAMVWRLGVALDGERDSGASWGFLAVLLTVLAGYCAYVGWMHATDQQWTLGWRK